MTNKKKTSNTLGQLEREILKSFRHQRNHQFTYRKLIQKYIKKYRKEEIISAVFELVEKGMLREKGSGRLMLNQETKTKRTDKEVLGIVSMIASGHAYIISDELKQDVFVKKKDLLRAFDGDTVKVLLFRPGRRAKLEGEVVEVVERAQESYLGTIQKNGKVAFVIPERNKMSADIFLPSKEVKKVHDGERVIARIVSWPAESKNPTGEIIEVLGKSGEHHVEMKSILVNNGFPLVFPDEVITQASAVSDKISKQELAKRRDLRSITTFTIDPDDAKDFDDALSVARTDDGNWEIGVHIADVSYYVKEGSALDKEAYRRATSVYLVDRVLPMLPEHLSNWVCSLRPDEEKLCFSAMFKMNQEAEILDSWYGKTVIKSDRRFTYNDVQDIITTGKGSFVEEINLLNRLAGKLRETKFKNGAIAFETVEVQFKIDLEGVPLGILIKERNESHMLIEDFMLLANKSVAEFVTRRSKSLNQPFVYRTHDTPDYERLLDFKRFAAKFGHKLNIDTPRQVSSSMNKLMVAIKGKPEQDLLEQLAIRSMAKAEYSTSNIGHYGLAFDHYTHFTSPIRRYPDVLAHRILAKNLNKDLNRINTDKLQDQCSHCSKMERKALTAERESIKYKQVEFLSDQIGQEFRGLITGVVHYGLFVELIENKCEGLVDVKSLGTEYYVYDEHSSSLAGVESGTRYQLGDRIMVRVVQTNLSKRQIDFEIVSQPA